MKLEKKGVKNCKSKIKVSKKADSLFPCVSAASICAKVIRDNVLKNWVYTEDLTVKEYGSGYPGDPKTKMFLDSNINQVFGFVKLIRFSWSMAELGFCMEYLTPSTSLGITSATALQLSIRSSWLAWLVLC